MNAAVLSNTLADRFAWLIEGLCKVVGAQAYKRGVEAALAWAVWNRVRVLGERLSALMTRARSGRLPSRSRRRDTSPRPSPHSGEGDDREARKSRAAGPRLPREFGWIRGMVPETAEFAGVLAWLLRDPEMAALVGKTPEAGRILRPLCHLLGVKAPDFLRHGHVPADPQPDMAAPPPIAEIQGGDAGSAEASAAAEPTPPVEAPAATDMPAQPSPPAVPYHQRPGGLIWTGRRFDWA